MYIKSQSEVDTARKTIFSFFRRPEKMVFPKKIALEYDLSRIIGKDHVSLSRKYNLNPRRKMKEDLFQRNTRKYDIFFRRSFQKGPRRDMVFLALSGKMGFFSRKHDFFSLGRKPVITPLKKHMEIWYFLCTLVGVTNLVSRPPAKNNHGWPNPAKIPLKVIDVLDWHLGKSSSNSLYLHRDLYGRFHVLLSSEKNQET